MFNINLRIFLRSIRKNPFYTGLNILGLSSAITLSLLLLFYCMHELSYDRFHSNIKSLYLLRMDYISNGEVIFNMYPPTQLYEQLANRFPDVTDACRVYIEKDIVVQQGTNVFREGNLLKVDSGFFDLFTFEVKYGDQNSVFTNPLTILISDEIAAKYFGDEVALGKYLMLPGKGEYVIGGVLDIPSTSSIQFDFVISTLPVDEITWQFGVVAPLYFTCDSPVAANRALEKMQGSIDDNFGQGSFRLELVPMAKQYFDSSVDFSLHGDIRYVSIFLSLSAIIIVLSVLNYINLSTAQSIKRAKEIGIRKVVGAGRSQLMRQHLFESCGLVAMSMTISALFIFLLMDTFKVLAGKEISVLAFDPYVVILFLMLFFVLLSCLAGFYPAFWVTRLLPVTAIKNQPKPGVSGIWFRKGMIVFQFTITVLFIIMSMVMQSQIEFMKNQKLGFDKDQILRLKVSQIKPNENSAIQNYSAIKKDLLQIKDISYVTVCPMPDFDATFEGIYNQSGEEKSTNAYVFSVDEDFIDLIGVNLLSGRNFAGGTDAYNSIIINQTAANLFFEGDPIGMQNKMLSKKKVIGVINDFYFKGMRSKVEPLVLEYFSGSFNSIQIKLNTNDLRRTIQSVNEIWKKYAGDEVFEYSFLDEDYNKLYFNEIRTANVFSIFCIASVIIACLGLIGIASYSLRSQQKSLSIRKVFGATSNDNFWLVSLGFLKPVILSFMIALPVSFWLRSLYLEDFANKVDTGLWVPLKGVIITFLLVFISVGLQCYKASNNKVLENLKEE